MKRYTFLLIGVLLALMVLVGGAVAQGATASAPFPIGPAAGDKSSPVAAMDADGKSIVAWNQSAQRISADGSAIGTPIQLDTVNDNSVVEDISADPAGNFVVVWYLYYEVRGRCFQADGTPLGPDFALDDMGRGGESPAVEVAPDGSFVAVWVEQYYESGSGFDYQISARRLSSD